MNYKTLAEDAIEVAKKATQSSIAADHMARANVYATLYLAEQQNMSNRMQYAIDFATGDEHYAELGREIGDALGVKPGTVTDPEPEPSDPDWCTNCGRHKGHFPHCRAKKVTS